MKCKYYIFFLCTFFLLSLHTLFAQSFGIIYEASSFEVSRIGDLGASNSEGLIKHVFLNPNFILPDSSFQFSLRFGYAWNSIENTSEYNNSYLGFTINTDKTITSGIPFEIEFRFQRLIARKSFFEPLIGIGLGFYYYDTKHTSNSNTSAQNFSEERRYITKGFDQYLTLGTDFYLSPKIIGRIQLKKIILSSVFTSYTNGGSTYEIDYPQITGLDDLAISLGMFYNF